MARVVVVRPAPGKISAVTLEHLRKKGQLILNDVKLTWRPGQTTALDHWDIAQGRDVGSVIATLKGKTGERRDVPYDVTFAFVVFAFHPEVVIVKD